jgi:hypothetical protein
MSQRVDGEIRQFKQRGKRCRSFLATKPAPVQIALSVERSGDEISLRLDLNFDDGRTIALTVGEQKAWQIIETASAMILSLSEAD